MRKLLEFFMMVALAVLFSACKDEEKEEESVNYGKLYGKLWVLNKAYSTFFDEVTGKKEEYKFNSQNILKSGAAGYPGNVVIYEMIRESNKLAIVKVYSVHPDSTYIKDTTNTVPLNWEYKWRFNAIDKRDNYQCILSAYATTMQEVDLIKLIDKDKERNFFGFSKTPNSEYEFVWQWKSIIYDYSEFATYVLEKEWQGMSKQEIINKCKYDGN